MAMTVRNNAAAMYALNQLGRNDSDLTKQLKKVSSGLRINGAGDDASSYAISVRLRSLEGAYGQDIQNAQTGANLVAVAEGGIQSVVDNLRTMKEMMLNARNDTNTDADRATIQKEFDKRLATITDIAAETNYNGRLLLNGDYTEPQNYVERQTKSKLIGTQKVHFGPPSVTTTQASSGSTGTTLTQNNGVQNLAANFTAYQNCSKKGGGIKTININSEKYQFDYTMSFPRNSGTTSTGDTYDIKIDFSGAQFQGTSTLPDALDGQGFFIMCSACNEYVNFKFDSSITAKQSTYNIHQGKIYGFEYVIGVKDVTDIADLPATLFEGIKEIPFSKRSESIGYQSARSLPKYSDKPDDCLVDSSGADHNLRIVQLSDGAFVFRREDFSMFLLNDKATVLTTTDAKPGTDGLPDEGTTIIDTGYDMDVPRYETYEEDVNVHIPGNPLIIHTGPKQGQYIPVFINSMHPRALGIDGARVDDDRILDKTEPVGDPSVNKFAKLLQQVDDAIDYALNEIVRMGAYRQRLSMTEDNLATAQENTINAKSTIADADMAKEMTNYTKANVLAQTAQSMVAQANQNLGGVLDLLQ